MKTYKMILAVAAGSTLLAFSTLAQPGGGPGGQQGGRGGGGWFGLDDQQRTLLREAYQRDSEQYQKLDEQLRNAQKELMKVVLAEPYEEKSVREKADAVSKIQTEMLMIRSKALSTVAPTLNQDQRTQLVDSRMGTMLLGGGGMDMMGGRGGFQGPGQGQWQGPGQGQGGFDPTAGGRGGRGFGGGPGGGNDPATTQARDRGGRDRGSRDNNQNQTPPR